MPLLEDTNHPWSTWLAPGGLGRLKVRIAQRYNDSGLLLEAASRGLGVALARRLIAARAIEEGRLVRLYRREVKSARAYWVVHPPALADDARVVAFKSWLRDQLAENGDAHH